MVRPWPQVGKAVEGQVQRGSGGRQSWAQQWSRYSVPCSEEILNYVLVRVQPPHPSLPRPRFSLYLSAQLQIGVIRVYFQQCQYLVGKTGTPDTYPQPAPPGQSQCLPLQVGQLPPCPSCPQRTFNTSWSACTAHSCRSASTWPSLSCEHLCRVAVAPPSWEACLASLGLAH